MHITRVGATRRAAKHLRPVANPTDAARFGADAILLFEFVPSRRHVVFDLCADAGKVVRMDDIGKLHCAVIKIIRFIAELPNAVRDESNRPIGSEVPQKGDSRAFVDDLFKVVRTGQGVVQCLLVRVPAQVNG